MLMLDTKTFSLLGFLSSIKEEKNIMVKTNNKFFILHDSLLNHDFTNVNPCYLI